MYPFVRVLALLLCCASVLSAADQKFVRTPNGIEGQYLVLLDEQSRPNLSKKIADLRSQFGGELQQSYGELGAFYIHMPEQGAKAMANIPWVRYVVEKTPGVLTAAQQNPGWALDRVDQSSPTLDNWYNYSCGFGSTVPIYIMDFGINPHIDLQDGAGVSRIRNLFSFDGINFNDCQDHGTGVASVAAGRNFGVAKNAPIVNVKVGCTDGFNTDFAAGVNAIRVDHADFTKAVVNISLIFPQDPIVDNAVMDLANDGMFVVIGAGNGNINGSWGSLPGDTANYSPQRLGSNSPRIVTVSATMHNGQTDSRAERLSTPWSANIGEDVEIFAPGLDVLSASAAGGTRLHDGTSFAAPMVAGQAARLLDGSTAYNVDNVQQALIDHSTKDVIDDERTAADRLLMTNAVSLGSRCRPVSHW